jgi:hypothetical protein
MSAPILSATNPSQDLLGLLRNGLYPVAAAAADRHLIAAWAAPAPGPEFVVLHCAAFVATGAHQAARLALVRAMAETAGPATTVDAPAAAAVFAHLGEVLSQQAQSNAGVALKLLRNPNAPLGAARPGTPLGDAAAELAAVLVCESARTFICMRAAADATVAAFLEKQLQAVAGNPEGHALAAVARAALAKGSQRAAGHGITSSEDGLRMELRRDVPGLQAAGVATDPQAIAILSKVATSMLHSVA